MSPQQLPLVSFRIAPHSSSAFKSIKNLVWEDIPDFAVLTGKNGAGKSQLLLYLAHALNDAFDDHQFPDLRHLRLEVTGDVFEPGDTAYVPDSGGQIHESSLSIANLQNIKSQTFQALSSNGNQASIYWRRKVNWLRRLLGNNFLSRGEASLPDDLTFMLEDSNVLHGLTHVFLAYRFQLLQELEKGRTVEEARTQLGPPPWELLNEVLKAAEFPYTVDAPQDSILVPYNFVLKEEGNAVSPKDLSSGEKVILQLALWLYNSQHHNRFPKLLLLDEPDAHLHPSMTRQFMNVIQEVLVNRYKVRVIITTHSPSTVALAPEDAVFEMVRGDPTIHKSVSKASAIGLLTAGLVVVSPTTRFVLVEDSSDVEFYDTVREVLSDFGPNKDPLALEPAPSIVFLPASSGRGAGKIGGGKDAVVNWVAKFDAPPFDQLIKGIIDFDVGNVGNQRVFPIQRYSIENYLLDPFVVFGALIELGTASSLLGTSISLGNEHLIRALPENELQSIVDGVQRLIEPHLHGVTAAEQTKQPVRFSNGKQVHYPNWIISRRGHDLLPTYQAAFGGPGAISPPKLLKSFQRVRLLPVELAELMRKLQLG